MWLIFQWPLFSKLLIFPKLYSECSVNLKKPLLILQTDIKYSCWVTLFFLKISDTVSLLQFLFLLLFCAMSFTFYRINCGERWVTFCNHSAFINSVLQQKLSLKILICRHLFCLMVFVDSFFLLIIPVLSLDCMAH